MSKVYLLTGGNLGNRVAYLQRAEQMIGERCGRVLFTSSLYETAAWGPIVQESYLNQVLLIETLLDPLNLLRHLLEIENEMGRKRNERYAPRTIDIDILFYGDLIIDKEEIIIPHPRLYTRRFVLVPLAEIAPELEHPILGVTIKSLLEQCADPLDVKKFIEEDAAD